jgi:hypothetical protein
MTAVLWLVLLIVLLNVGLLLWAFWIDRAESIRERQMAGPTVVIGGFGDETYPDREIEVPPDEFPGVRL